MAVDVVSKLGSLRVYVKQGTQARHKPLSLLWALGRVRGGQQQYPWEQFSEAVRPLLVEFGAEGFSATPEYPFWYLRSSGVWEVDGVGEGIKPSRALFDREKPTAGFTAEAYAVLRADRTVLAGAVGALRSHLADTDVAVLLDRVGLGEYGSASGVARREVTRAVLARDRKKADWVKALHDHRCQVCATRLAVPGGAHSEAAHIRGLGGVHEGHDEVWNMLCLCPNCHTRFDALAIYVDAGGVVRELDGAPIAELRVHPGHAIDAGVLRYQRVLCGVAE